MALQGSKFCIGRLDTKVGIYRVSGETSYASPSATYVLSSSAWMEKKETGGGEKVGDGLERSETMYEFTMRTEVDLLAGDRLVVNGLNVDVLSVFEPDTRTGYKKAKGIVRR